MLSVLGLIFFFLNYISLIQVSFLIFVGFSPTPLLFVLSLLNLVHPYYQCSFSAYNLYLPACPFCGFYFHLIFVRTYFWKGNALATIFAYTFKAIHYLLVLSLHYALQFCLFLCPLLPDSFKLWWFVCECLNHCLFCSIVCFCVYSILLMPASGTGTCCFIWLLF